MEESFGIFIINKKKKELLICRPTGIKGNTGWTIPKGKKEKDESDKDSAIRETWEETGLDLKEFKKDLILLGTKRYKTRKKRLTGFILYIKKDIDVSELKCDCKITGKDRPEIDKYEWVDLQDALTRIHEAQGRLLEEYITGDKHGEDK